jgi:hypothetical protein
VRQPKTADVSRSDVDVMRLFELGRKFRDADTC